MRYRPNPDRIAATVETPYRTLHVYEEADGRWSVRDDATGAPVDVTDWRRDENGVMHSRPGIFPTFTMALDAAEEEGYRDYQDEEGAKAERAADPLGLFL